MYEAICCWQSIKNLDKITEHQLLPNYPEIPWKNVMGVRDFIVHHYFEVDADVIYGICKQDVPALIVVIERMMEEMSVTLHQKIKGI